MTFKNYKSLKIGDWNFKKLIRASDGLVLFEKKPSLPYNRRVACLRSTGTQYIDTGIVLTGSHEIYLRVYIEQHDNQGTLIYCGTGYPKCWITSGYSRYSENNIGKADKFIRFKAYNEFILNEKTETINGKSQNLPLGKFGTPGTQTAYLFRANGRSAISNNLRISDWSVKKDGVLIQKLIPVIDLSGRPAMYDEITGQMFYNKGKGEFDWDEIVENPYITDGLVNMFDALLVPNWQDVIGNALMTGTSATEGYTNLGYQIVGVNWPELYKGAFTIQIAFKQTAINDNWYSLLENKGTRSGYYSLDVRIAWTKSLSTYAISCRAKQASASRLPITGFEKGTPFYGTITISAPASVRGTYTFNDNQPVYYALTGSADYAPASDVITSSSGQNKNKTRVYGIRIYNRALTEDEIAANYAIDKQRFNI